jgi:hypothetical protein
MMTVTNKKNPRPVTGLGFFVKLIRYSAESSRAVRSFASRTFKERS